jgi:pimeloyl-ACP methyl ester carboxylesterase
LTAIRDALDVLDTGSDHVRPRRDQFALIGHSAGGNLAAQLAAITADPGSGLPEIRAVVAVMPGEVIPNREPDLSRIPGRTLLVVMVGEEDILVGDLRGRQIFAGATAVPRERKRYILLRSDRHGYPPLIADHAAPTSSNRHLDSGDGLFRGLQLNFGDVNALDRAGLWRMTDVILSAAFNDRSLDQAIDDPERFRHLGYWSDGRPVVPPLISDDLSNIPRVLLPNGVRLFPWGGAIKVGAKSPSRGEETEIR